MGFNFYLFQAFWLCSEFILAFCSLPCICLTTANNPDLEGLARPWRDRQLKFCLSPCPKLSQSEPRQKPRIAITLLNFPDSPDVIAVLTHTDKVGPQQGECGHFPFKADPVERWSHAHLLGSRAGRWAHIWTSQCLCIFLHSPKRSSCFTLTLWLALNLLKMGC